jgi:fimbrial isopeptide formation D2 family protein
MDSTTSTTIVIENAQSGHTYTAYRLGRYVSATSSGGNLTALSVASASARAERAVRLAVGDAPEKADAVSYAAATMAPRSAQLRSLADQLSQSIRASGVPAASGPVSSAGPGSDVIFDGLAQGWYFILDQYVPSAGSAGAAVRSESERLMTGVGIVVGTTVTDAITQKRYTTLVGRGAVGSVGSQTPLGRAGAAADDSRRVQDSGDAAMWGAGALMPGNTVDFQISATIPDYLDVDSGPYDFAFVDTPGAGFDLSSVRVAKVAIADSASIADAATQRDITSQKNKPDGFTVSPGAALTGQFSLDFSDFFTLAQERGVKDFVGKTLKVNYSMKVAQEDDFQLDRLTNEFFIEDQGQRVPGAMFDPHSVVETSTFTEVDESGRPLNGAKFDLITSHGTVSGTAISGDADGDGVVTEAESQNPTTAGAVAFRNTIVTWDREYTMLETEAPQGYMSAKVALGLTYHQPAFEAPAIGSTVATPRISGREGHEATLGHSEVVADAEFVEIEGDDPLDLVTISPDCQSVTVKNVRTFAQSPLTGSLGTVLLSVIAVSLCGGVIAMVCTTRNACNFGELSRGSIFWPEA